MGRLQQHLTSGGALRAALVLLMLCFASMTGAQACGGAHSSSKSGALNVADIPAAGAAAVALTQHADPGEQHRATAIVDTAVGAVMTPAPSGADDSKPQLQTECCGAHCHPMAQAPSMAFTCVAQTRVTPSVPYAIIAQDPPQDFDRPPIAQTRS